MEAHGYNWNYIIGGCYPFNCSDNGFLLHFPHVENSERRNVVTAKQVLDQCDFCEKEATILVPGVEHGQTCKKCSDVLEQRASRSDSSISQEWLNWQYGNECI